MDARLLAWARAVKKRRGGRLPVLWLFTDSLRLADATDSIRALPPGLSGVVFRQDDAPDRAARAARVAALCRRRGVEMVVSGDARLARKLGVGLHLRDGRYQGRPMPVRGLLSSSAHHVPDILRACRAGADFIFISPAFSTLSHPGGEPLGPVRWARLARYAGDTNAYALGGVTGSKIIRLARFCRGVGAIHALKHGNS